MKKDTKNSEHQQTPVTDPRDAKIAELTNDLQRTRADFENYRKQMDAQKASAANAAKFATVSQFLPLLDDLERAIAATPELQPLMKTLEKTTKDLGLTKIDSTPGTDFNPDFHDAISMEESDGEKEVISETLRPGYFYTGMVLRPAMVKVKTI